MEWSHIRWSSGWTVGRFFAETVVKSLEQAPQETAQGLKPVRVPRSTWSMSYGLVLGSPAKSRELDLMVLMSHFQLEIFFDSLLHQPTFCQLPGKKQWKHRMNHRHPDLSAPSHPSDPSVMEADSFAMMIFLQWLNRKLFHSLKPASLFIWTMYEIFPGHIFKNWLYSVSL